MHLVFFTLFIWSEIKNKTKQHVHLSHAEVEKIAMVILPATF